MVSRRVRRPRRHPPPTSPARTAPSGVVPRPRGRSSRNPVGSGARAPRLLRRALRLPRQVRATSEGASLNLPTASHPTVVGVATPVSRSNMVAAATNIAVTVYFRPSRPSRTRPPPWGIMVCCCRSAIPAEMSATPAAAAALQAAINSANDWSCYRLMLRWVIDLLRLYPSRDRRSGDSNRFGHGLHVLWWPSVPWRMDDNGFSEVTEVWSFCFEWRLFARGVSRKSRVSYDIDTTGSKERR